MERLTIRNSDGTVSQPVGMRWADALERLAAYEDTGLTPDDLKRTFAEDAIIKLAAQVFGVSVFRLRELAQADKEGRVVVLPCRVGDTVFILGSIRELYSARVRTFFCGHPATQGKIYGDVRMVRTTECDIPMRELGKTFFLTREEAEAALERRKGERDG